MHLRSSTERGSVAPWLAMILIATACVLFIRLGLPGIHVMPERRSFEVTRTMVASGDWWIPIFDKKPRINKPPLYYWVASGVSQLRGETTPASVRLFAAVSALALVALTFAWGRLIGGPMHGLVAAALLATMKWFVVFGRRGVAEMPLAFFCIAALLCYERLRITRRPALLPVFALCLTLAILAKATAALLIIGVPIALDLALRGELRAALRPRVAGWVGAALVAGFGWYGVVLARVPGAWDVLMMALWLPLGIESTVVPNTALHYGSSGFYYVRVLPLLALPGLLLLPLSLVRAWRTRLWAADHGRRFPALAFGALFFAFSLLPQKQAHYLLPLLPMLALVLAEPLARAVAKRPEAVRHALRALGMMAGAFGAILLAAAVGFYGWLIGAPAACLALLLGGGSVLIASCVAAGARRHVVAFVSWCTLGWLAATGIVRLDYELHQEMRKRGELELRTDAGSQRWERAFERLERLERSRALSGP